MIFDKQTLLSDQQAITATANSTNVIDLGAMGIPFGNVEALKRDVGKGKKVPLRIQVTEDFATLTSLTIDIVTSDSATLASGNIVHDTSGAIPVASLKKGWVFSQDTIPIAQGSVPMKRYLGIVYTVTGTNATAGKVTAGVTMGNQTNDTI